MSLLENIPAQIRELHMMGKSPRALIIDRDSLECLARETPFSVSPFWNRIYGLEIEVSDSPNFDVVE